MNNDFIEALQELHQRIRQHRLLGDIDSALTAEEISDLVWLATYLPARSQSSMPGTTDRSSIAGSQDSFSPKEQHATDIKVNPDSGSSPPYSMKSPPPITDPHPSAPVHFRVQDMPESGVAYQRGLPFTATAAPPLRDPLDIERALFPLKKRLPSKNEIVFDEVATAQYIADTRHWWPCFRPATSCRFDVVLLVESSPVMEIWDDTIAALRRLLARQGGFRNVIIWNFEARGGTVKFYSGYNKRWLAPRKPQELIDEEKKRLFFVFSHCASPGWMDGSVAQALATWQDHSLVTLVQMLPELLWERTALCHYSQVRVRSQRPYVTNSSLCVRELYSFTDTNLDRTKEFVLPVIAIMPEYFLRWSKLATATDREELPAVVLPLSPSMGDRFNESESDKVRQPSERLSATEQVNRFREASPQAGKLATYLAAAPLLTLPIARLIQHAMLPVASRLHLAEVFLSGLLQRVPDTEKIVHLLWHEDVQYKFPDEIQEELLRSIDLTETFDVFEEVDHYIAAQHGTQPAGIDSLLIDLSQDHGSLDTEFAVHAKPFAGLAANVLRKLGGYYAQLAEQLVKISPTIVNIETTIEDLNTLIAQSSVTSYIDIDQQLVELENKIHNAPSTVRVLQKFEKLQIEFRAKQREQREKARGRARETVDSGEPFAQQHEAWKHVLDIDPSTPEANEALYSLYMKRVAEIRHRKYETQHDLLVAIRDLQSIIVDFPRYINDQLHVSDLESTEVGAENIVPLSIEEIIQIQAELQTQCNEVNHLESEAKAALAQNDYPTALDRITELSRQGFEIVLDDQTGEPISTSYWYLQVQNRWINQMIDYLRSGSEALKRFDLNVAENVANSASKFIHTVTTDFIIEPQELHQLQSELDELIQKIDEAHLPARTFLEQLNVIKTDIAAQRFIEAEAQLETLRSNLASSHTVRPTLSIQLEETKRELLNARRAELENALRTARETKREGALIERQRAHWLKVLDIESSNPEAVTELGMLDRVHFEIQVQSDLTKLRNDLPQISKDIIRLQAARAQVQTWLVHPNLHDPQLRQIISNTFDILDRYRQEIQRASEGGISSERTNEYEKAIDVYRRAISANYKIIIDDTTGEPLDPVESLRRTIKAFVKDQIQRAETRYNEAVKMLSGGAPELAMQRLTQAKELLLNAQKIVGNQWEKSGSEWREQVEKLLDEARHQVQQKQEAAELVISAEEKDDPQQSRLLLLRAQQRYPTYPQIDELIRTKEQQVLRSVVNYLRSDIARAEMLLNQRKFEDARTVCEHALHTGQNLDFASKDSEYQTHQNRVTTLLERIGIAQSRWQKLQEQLAAIRTALTANNLTLARRLFDKISDEDAADRIVINLRTELSLLSDDDEKWRDAQRAFGAQSYEQVITLCERLQESASVPDRATNLLRRAQARWWSQQAAAATSLDQVESFYHKLVGLRGLLPAEDVTFVEDAETKLKALQQERRSNQQFKHQLEDIQKLRIGGKWTEWYQQLLVLEQEAPDSFKGEISTEQSSGIEEWYIDAFNQAERLLVGNQIDHWRKAYELVYPLYRIGAVTDKDRRYREIARNYYQSEAERWEASSDPRDLEKAVEYRRNAFNLAEQPALAEKRALVNTIRQRALRQAQFAATNSSPQEAVAVLQQQLTTHEFDLKEDPELREQLLHYALLSDKFEVVQREAQVLQFLPGMGEVARSWQQLAQAFQRFRQESSLYGREQIMRELARLRSSLIPTTPLLTVTLAEFTINWAEELHSTLPPMPRLLTNEGILQRVRIYDLILQLRPEDVRARNGIVQLADRLQQIGQQLVDRTRQLLGSQYMNTYEELKQLDILAGELRALLQAFDLLNQNTTLVVQQLIQQQGRIQDRLQQLNNLHRQLEEVDVQYRRTAIESWVIEPVADALQAALQIARQIDVIPQLAEWEGRVNQLVDIIALLKSILAEIEHSWVSDQFQAVIISCDRFNQELNQARVALGVDNITLPRDHLVLYDSQGQRRLSALDDIREVAAVKEQNLTIWRRWVERFQTLQAEVSEANAAAEQELGASPPCLTRGREHLVTLSKQYEALLQYLTQLPPNPLCSEAERYAKQLDDANVQTESEWQIKSTQTKLKEVDIKLKTAEQPLQRMRTFMRGNPNLRLKANQRTFYVLIQAVREIDICHPDLKPFVELYQRYTNQAI